MAKKYAVIENNRVINVVVGVEPDVLAADPTKYIDVTDGWDFSSPINAESFFKAPEPPAEETPAV
jgi:chorismate mutase